MEDHGKCLLYLVGRDGSCLDLLLKYLRETQGKRAPVNLWIVPHQNTSHLPQVFSQMTPSLVVVETHDLYHETQVHLMEDGSRRLFHVMDESDIVSFCTWLDATKV